LLLFFVILRFFFPDRMPPVSFSWKDLKKFELASKEKSTAPLIAHKSETEAPSSETSDDDLASEAAGFPNVLDFEMAVENRDRDAICAFCDDAKHKTSLAPSLEYGARQWCSVAVLITLLPRRDHAWPDTCCPCGS
jgi:hypothetical protein